MFGLPLHPAVVHLPLGLAMVVPLVAVVLLIAVTRQWSQPRVWWLAVLLQAVLFISGIVAMNTGEQDEDRVEKVVPTSAIEAHESAAKQFVWGGTLVTLVVMVIVAFLPTSRLFMVGGGVSVALAIVTLVLGLRVGHLGGELVYRHNAANVYAAPTPPSSAPHTSHDRD